MPKHILFLQGAGEGAYDADAKLVQSLSRELGGDYEVIFPPMPHEEAPSYEAWKSAIEEAIAQAEAPLVLVGHSAGASMLLKYLSENKPKTEIAGMFLLAAPFWGGEGWLYPGYEALELPKNLEAKLPKEAPVFLYYNRDDEIVAFNHLALYKTLLPHATERSRKQGGHMFGNDIGFVAEDIQKLTSAS